jgi:GTP-binding protein
LNALDFSRTFFLSSAAQSSHLPTDHGAEIAFIGRSNSGKSSAINAITGIKGLAKTSKTPGHTQLLNFFQIAQNQRLVDLPGYGYATVNKKQQQDWEKIISSYFKTRKSLKGVIITMDSRHPLKASDQSMLGLATYYQIPVYILLTKMDKLSRQESLKTLKKTTQQLTAQLYPPHIIQLFSSTQGIGLTPVRQTICVWLNKH